MTAPDRREQALVVDPAELMRDNPAALIVNAESYDLISSRFDPRRFDLPQVSRVRTFSASRDEVIKLFLIDGNTRTKYVNDHSEEIRRDYPDFTFQARDVTASLLDNPKIVASDKSIAGRDYLELDEWLKAVIPPTVEHSKIAPDRIAAYLINGWDNMVGSDLAGKFSAIAALSLLRNPRVPIATDALFSQYLSKQDKIMAGETGGERKKLEEAFLQMASIIRQTKLLREHIAESAFILVASGSSVIGGERESLKQIYGLLHLPAVEQKLAEGVGQHEQMRQEFGINLAAAFRKFSNAADREQIFNILGRVIRDPELSFDQVQNILLASVPTEAYDVIRRDLNVRKLENTYLDTQKRSEVTEVEQKLISILGDKAYLDERSLPAVIRSIAAAAQALKQVSDYKQAILQKRCELQNSGVRPQTIDAALDAADKAPATIFSATTPQTLSLRAGELTTSVTEVNRKITREVAVFKASQIIDTVYGDRVQNGHGTVIKARIAAFLAAEFGKIDNSNEAQVSTFVNQLASLDEDLHTRVITGEMRLQVALRAQTDRKQTIKVSQQPVPQSQAPFRNQVVTPGQTARRTDVQPIVSSPAPAVSHDLQLPDKRALDERRKTLSNEKLQEAACSFIGTIDSIDLESAEIAGETQEKIKEMLRKVGKLMFNHPDVVRALEEYPQLLKELNRIRGVKLYQERQETDRDAKTQI